MRIHSLEIENYKSFASSGNIIFPAGISVIVGRNNVGKTAFLEAMSFRLSSNPHISITNKPYSYSRVDPVTIIHVAFALDAGETEQVFIDTGNNDFYVPRHRNMEINTAADWFIDGVRKPSILRGVYRVEGAVSNFTEAYLDSYGLPDSPPDVFRYSVNMAQRRLDFSGDAYPHASGPQYGTILANALVQRIYAFRAERMNIGTSSEGANTVLAADARNLAEVLRNLSADNPDRYQLLNEHISTIFPDIHWISVHRLTNPAVVEIRVWPVERSTQRSDLAISLNDSGTGIGQVLAMLYVVLTSDYPQTIVIDEPQSFLHPGAVRKLLDILRQYSRHQYIMTTHSPEIISAANTSGLFLLRKEGAETKVESVSTNETQHLRAVLTEVGTRFSDVFGADSILWVEGPTEEASFPLIVERLMKRQLLGTKILGMVKTGDFEGKFAERVLQIYKTLSQGGSLMPPALGFIFDREERDDSKIADITRRMSHHVHFLPRRMYECYLLDPDALAAVIQESITGFSEIPVTAAKIEVWISEHRARYSARDAAKSDSIGENWVTYVDGAKLLEGLFADLSERRVVYEKTLYGPLLTSWLIDHKPNTFDDIKRILETLMIG